MGGQEKDLRAILEQKLIPVVYRPGGSRALRIRLPFARDNRDWLRNGQHSKPKWDPQRKSWEVPKAWFDDLITRLLARFGRVYVVQPYRIQDKCAPACWNAQGFECECSCMGANHGSHAPCGKWHVVSETCAVRWGDRELACRLITATP